jgi:DNA polymerase-3 subunit epsilon
VSSPADDVPAPDLRLLALDLETSGLDPARDRVLAIGMVPVDGERVDLSGARRVVVRDGTGPGEAVVVHGLTHDDLDDGVPLAEALDDVTAALTGRALLAHHARFDQTFLDAALSAAGRPVLDAPVVCTLQLQRRLLTRTGQEVPPGALRLWRSRSRYGLPPVRAHDALGDALACAELYLAQVAELTASGPVALRDLRLRPEPLTGLLRRLRRWWRARRRSRTS